MNKKLLVSGIILSLIVAYFIIPPIYNQYQQEQFYNNMITATAVSNADLARVLYYYKQLQDDINALNLRVTTNENDIAQILIDIANLQSAINALQLWQTQHPQISEYDYIVGKWDNGTIYALSGRTGTIVYSGTNASQVIQNCIDALRGTDRGVVFIKARQYDIDTTINIPYGLYLVGESSNYENGTRLIAETGLNLVLNFSGYDTEYHEKGGLSHIYIGGNLEEDSAGIRIDRFLWFYIDNIRIYGFDVNIELTNNYGCVIEKSKISSSLSYGILSRNNSIDSQSTGLIVSHCDINPYSGWGIGLNRSFRNVITENWFEYGPSRNGSWIYVIDSFGTRIIGNMIGATRASNYGIKLESITTQVDETVIIGNTFNLNGTAIYVGDNCPEGIIDGNTFEMKGNNTAIHIDSSRWIVSNNMIENEGSGIRIESSEVKVEGNKIYNCAGDGIIVGNGYFKCDIIGNTISEVDGWGIYCLGERTLIASNFIFENGKDGILVVGDNNTVQGNVVYDNNQLLGSYSGIRIGSAQHCFITNNFVFNSTTQEYGIEEGGTADNNVIFGNMVGSGTMGDIRIIGVNTVSQDNYPFT